MERLTEVENGTAMVKGCGSNCKYGFEYCRKEDWENCKTIDDVIEKLAEYEDLEEQGLLLRLPVPIGTTVYEFEPLNKTVKECTKRTVIKYTVYDDSIWFNFADGYMKDIKDFGKTVFLTKEEAEQKLKEMESD